MRTRLVITTTAAVISLVCLSGCSSSPPADDTAEASGSSTPAAAPTNARGAIEVALGQPVTVTTPAGPFVTITDSRLAAAGCDSVDYADIPSLAEQKLTGQIRQVKFTATVKSGPVEMTQWLWSSDFYYVSKDGEAVQNLAVTQLDDTLSGTRCDGETSIIDLPPNSTAKGATTLAIPIGSENGGPVAIGYKAGDRRVEWTLPTDWVQKLGPVAASPPQTPSPDAITTDDEQPDPAPTPEVTFTCGDPSTYQPGTALYSDGTTGYEQACATAGETNPYGPQSRGDAVPAQPTQTFDPNSADGYGPNQQLPPLVSPWSPPPDPDTPKAPRLLSGDGALCGRVLDTKRHSVGMK